jgi:flavodoxin I
MKIAIVYSSVTGNTKELAKIIHQILLCYPMNAVMYHIKDFPVIKLDQFDVIVIGTYTWGNGEIPKEMRELYQAIEVKGNKSITTGVFGTGDTFYPKFCGAVDEFRNMLYVHTNLAVTLKVELLLELQDYNRCLKFVNSLLMASKKSFHTNSLK